MGAPMTIDRDDMITEWLNKIQATDLGDRQIMNPARTSETAGKIIKDNGGGLTFDTEPAAYYKLLRDIKMGQTDD